MSSKAWRDQVTEQALDPLLPIVDPHHHTWEVSPSPHFEVYGAEALFADKTGSGHNIVATVHIDCGSCYRTDGPEHLRVVGETEYVDKIGREAMRRGGKYANAVAAIVPTVNLLDWRHAGESLDAHLDASPRMRGIRFKTAFDDSLQPVYGCREPGVMLRPEFRKGFAELAKRNLSFDAWLFQTQLAEVDNLARAFPQTTIVLNHLGGPFVDGRYKNHAAQSIADWKTALKKVAANENVFLKIGALNMAHTGVSAIDLPRPRTSEETAALQRDYILTAIDIFGPARCMFESNFPVDMRTISYTVLWNVFKRVTAGFSVTERADLFAGTAAWVYRLKL